MMGGIGGKSFPREELLLVMECGTGPRMILSSKGTPCASQILSYLHQLNVLLYDINKIKSVFTLLEFKIVGYGKNLSIMEG